MCEGRDLIAQSMGGLVHIRWRYVRCLTRSSCELWDGELWTPGADTPGGWLFGRGAFLGLGRRLTDIPALDISSSSSRSAAGTKKDGKYVISGSLLTEDRYNTSWKQYQRQHHDVTNFSTHEEIDVMRI